MRTCRSFGTPVVLIAAGLMTLLLTATPSALAQGTGAAPAAAEREFGDEYYFYPANNPKRAQHLKMEGKPAPALTVGEWNGTPVDITKLRGQVVVVDFWATWCGPCVRAIPKNIKMVEKYGKKGFTIVGVHDTKRGWDKVDAMVKSKGINYSIALDKDGTSTKAWNVRFWPTYAVIDHKGIVRAVGVKPDKVEAIVTKLMKEMPERSAAADTGASADVPSQWLEGKPAQRKKLERGVLAADTPPSLDAAENWINSEPIDLASLKGQVVVLDFWATWCGPCKRAIPHTNEMMAKYGGEGLVIIGVCAKRGHETMADIVAKYGIKYPVCADVNGVINKAYGPNGFPDYFIIDRAGNVRVADCKNNMVEEAVQALLAENG